MAPVNFVHLLAVLSFAILQVSFVTLPANALAVERGYIGRDHVHAGIIKRQGGSSKRCKPRKSSDKSSINAYNGSTTYDHTSPPATTSTTTTSPHQTPTSTPSRSKRILLWANTVEPALKNFVSPNSGIHISHWTLKPPGSGELGASYDLFQTLQFLPKFWGHQADIDYSHTLLGGNPTYPIISTINEPNIDSQANMSPQSAATYWTSYIEPLAKYSQLLSPAVTADRIDWMRDFLKACGGKCSVHAMDIHVYEIDPNVAIGYANKFHQEFNMDVWYGEMGCHSYANDGKSCDQNTFDKFYNGVMDFVDKTDWLVAIGWFGFFGGQIPNGVDATNQMMHCSNVNDPSTCYPNDLGKRFLAGN